MPLSFNDGEFQILVDELVAGVDAALYSLKTWLGMWVHLPLGICRLGDDNEQEFVFTYAKVIFKMPWNSNAQIQYYIQEHEYDTDSVKEKALPKKIVEESTEYGKIPADELFDNLRIM
ncbi:hypothetical protein C2G38_2233112 [Gigaspora rosea]|uniref:Uncharacterized protein n=1 Tax=Gigaspora rosea TaxID=44941 RepID=A0A397TV17_9GLOM|nr:hypothetical protein C2G38_2233112 [Gigaspora rosea]